MSTENSGNDEGIDVFETQSSTYFSHNDRDSKKLTSIAESKESGDELNNEGVNENESLSNPKITVNGEDNRGKPFNVMNGGHEVNSNSGVDLENNNEASQVTSTLLSGPTFYGVVVVEPCSVEQVQLEETLETPEVKVTCIREQSLDKEDESLPESNNEKHDVDQEVSSLDESLENGDEQEINVWIICQFLK